MSFTNKIKNYTNETSSENVTDALAKGVDYTLATVKLRNPAIWSQFAIKVDSGNSVFGDIYPTFNIFDLLSVDRKQGAVSYWARPIDEKMMQKAKDTKSIYFATYHDPVYSIGSDGVMDIQPTESSTNPASIYIVRDSGGKTITDATEVITDDTITFGGGTFGNSQQFPSFCKELVVLHAAECILMERMADFRTKLPTDLDADTTLFNQIDDVDLTPHGVTFPTSEVNDALTKAQNLIDGTDMGDDSATAESAQFWLLDEDEDMVGSTLSVAAQELGRANGILGRFNAELSSSTADLGLKEKEFQINLQKKMALYDKIIQKLTTDYQWTQGQLQLISAKKQEFIQHQLQGGVSDIADEGKARG